MNKPDWRKDKDYVGFDEKFPAIGWAWEFLRRNPEYVKDWILFNKEAAAYQNDLGSRWAINELTLRFDPPRLPGETLRKWNTRCQKIEANAEQMTLERSYARKWSLGKKMHDPSLPYTAIKRKIQFSDPLPYPKAVNALQELKPYLEDPDDPYNVVRPEHAVLAFNLKLPLDDQIKKTKRLLGALKKHVDPDDKRRDPSAWQFYLQVLDAKNDPAELSFKDIGIALNIASGDEYPDNKATNRTRDYHNRALEVMSDHIKILLPDKRRKRPKKTSSKR